MEHLSNYLALLLALVVMGLLFGRRPRWIPRKHGSLPANIIDDLFSSREKNDPVPRRVSRSAPREELLEALLLFFEQINVARKILKALYEADRPLTDGQAFDATNNVITQDGGRRLDDHVIRKVLMILMGANLVVKRDDLLQLTPTGRFLREEIRRRKRALDGETDDGVEAVAEQSA